MRLTVARTRELKRNGPRRKYLSKNSNFTPIFVSNSRSNTSSFLLDRDRKLNEVQNFLAELLSGRGEGSGEVNPVRRWRGGERERER